MTAFTVNFMSMEKMMIRAMKSIEYKVMRVSLRAYHLPVTCGRVFSDGYIVEVVVVGTRSYRVREMLMHTGRR